MVANGLVRVGQGRQLSNRDESGDGFTPDAIRGCGLRQGSEQEGIVSTTKNKALPQVAGTMECSASMFEHRCRVYLQREQEKIAPDNGLVAILCDAVRMAREFGGKPIDHQLLEAARAVLGANDNLYCGKDLDDAITKYDCLWPTGSPVSEGAKPKEYKPCNSCGRDPWHCACL